MIEDDGGFYRREYSQAGRGMDLPDVDDSVKFCPNCEKPNQFGELCRDCQYEQDCEAAELGIRGDE